MLRPHSLFRDGWNKDNCSRRRMWKKCTRFVSLSKDYTDNSILISKHIPCTIVQGRYDIVCPVRPNKALQCLFGLLMTRPWSTVQDRLGPAQAMARIEVAGCLKRRTLIARGPDIGVVGRGHGRVSKPYVVKRVDTPVPPSHKGLPTRSGIESRAGKRAIAV